MFCASDERFSAVHERVENSRLNFSPTLIHITSDFQTEPSRLLFMLLTGNHLQECAGAIMFSYSPPSTLHPQVTCIYAIAFSAGLNSLLVDKVDKENDKRPFPCTIS